MTETELRIVTAMVQINGLSPFTTHNRIHARDTSLLILPGPRDHNYREAEGIRLWKMWRAEGLVRHLLVAGTSEMPPLTRENVTDLCGEDPGDCLHFVQKARHTPDQMEWTLNIADNIGLGHLIISTAAYHLPRGFLTALKTMAGRGMRLVLSAAPVYDPDDPSRDFVGFLHTGGIGLQGEVERIVKYQEAGQVATIEEYLTYLKWRLAQ